MNREELIGKLQMVYIGDKRAMSELIDYYDELYNNIDKLLKENESLRARIKIIKRLRKKQTQKKNKYKSIVINFQKALEKKNNKIDKAIEYIEKDTCYDSEHTYYDVDVEDILTILEILKGGDVDE